MPLEKVVSRSSGLLAIALEHRGQRRERDARQRDQVVRPDEQVELGGQQPVGVLIEQREVQDDEQVVVVLVELRALVARVDVLVVERVELEVLLEPVAVGRPRRLDVDPAQPGRLDDLLVRGLAGQHGITRTGRAAATRTREGQVRHRANGTCRGARGHAAALERPGRAKAPEGTGGSSGQSTGPLAPNKSGVRGRRRVPRSPALRLSNPVPGTVPRIAPRCRSGGSHLPLRARRNVSAGPQGGQRAYPRTSPGGPRPYPRLSHRCGWPVDKPRANRRR